MPTLSISGCTKNEKKKKKKRQNFPSLIKKLLCMRDSSFGENIAIFFFLHP
jgi:hypothetical protein